VAYDDHSKLLLVDSMGPKRRRWVKTIYQFQAEKYRSQRGGVKKEKNLLGGGVKLERWGSTYTHWGEKTNKRIPIKKKK